MEKTTRETIEWEEEIFRDKIENMMWTFMRFPLHLIASILSFILLHFDITSTLARLFYLYSFLMCFLNENNKLIFLWVILLVYKNNRLLLYGKNLQNFSQSHTAKKSDLRRSHSLFLLLLHNCFTFLNSQNFCKYFISHLSR